MRHLSDGTLRHLYDEPFAAVLAVALIVAVLAGIVACVLVPHFNGPVDTIPSRDASQIVETEWAHAGASSTILDPLLSG